MSVTENTTMTVGLHPVLWIGAGLVLAIVVVQSLVYLRAARKAAPEAGMTGLDFTTAVRTGATSAIGPSLAVCLIAMAVLPVLATPSTLTRIGLVGSAAYETMAADVALGAMGSGLGQDNVTGTMFVSMLLALAIAGSGWMVVTLIATPLMKRGLKTNTKTAAGKASRWAVVPAAALVGAFFTMGLKEVSAGLTPLLVFLASAGVMLLATYLSKRTGKGWFLEWALGIALFVGIAVGYVLS
ncbi:DUF5058 family protein [Citricoccus parietis]